MQLQVNEDNESKEDKEIRTLGQDTISKAENESFSSDNNIFNQLQTSDRTPYHRTSGARFCPNGNILGKQRICRNTQFIIMYNQKIVHLVQR